MRSASMRLRLVSRREDAGRSPQRIDFETRIIRKRPEAGLRCIRGRLQSSVSGEGRARLFNLSNTRKF